MLPGIASISEPWPGFFVDLMATAVDACICIALVHYAHTRVTAHDSIGHVKRAFFGKFYSYVHGGSVGRVSAFHARAVGLNLELVTFFFLFLSDNSLISIFFLSNNYSLIFSSFQILSNNSLISFFPPFLNFFLIIYSLISFMTNKYMYVHVYTYGMRQKTLHTVVFSRRVKKTGGPDRTFTVL